MSREMSSDHSWPDVPSLPSQFSFAKKRFLSWILSSCDGFSSSVPAVCDGYMSPKPTVAGTSPFNPQSDRRSPKGLSDIEDANNDCDCVGTLIPIRSRASQNRRAHSIGECESARLDQRPRTFRIGSLSAATWKCVDANPLTESGSNS